jgi:hypothetical protein
LAARNERLAEEVFGGVEVQEGEEPADGVIGPELVHPLRPLVVEGAIYGPDLELLDGYE